jgi:hypothetical protein
VGLSRSSSPIETPPDVMMMSHLRRASRSVCSMLPGLLGVGQYHINRLRSVNLLVGCDAKVNDFKVMASGCCDECRAIRVPDLA